jgi:hypothetical protein
MNARFFGSMMVAVLGLQTASAVEVSWFPRPGSALSITGSASGSVWIVGTDRADEGGYNVYKWNAKEFIKQDTAVMPSRKLAVTTSDQLWLVTDRNELYGWVQFGTGGGSLLSLRKATDLAIGGDNSVWILEADQTTGGHSVYRKTGSTDWTKMNFGAASIAVDKGGNAWVVNDAGNLFMYNVVSKAWEKKPASSVGATARSVHAGATSGAVWMVGTASVPGGHPIFQWNSSKAAWEPYGTYGAVGITEAAGTPWIVQSDGRVFSKAPPITSTTPVDQTLTWPPPTGQAYAPIGVSQSGKALCSATNATDCGNTKADYVGKYSLDTTCDAGFYDPMYGGSCWKCPDDDGNGAWIRSLDAVNKDTACWRSPKESTGRANKVKSPAWLWECPAGSFWDGYSPDGAGGSCWSCPSNLPRRTAAPIWESNACASSLNETSRATFLTYNGCPKPDPTTMNLSGKRAPGSAFLDIAAVEGGGCFACPIMDETGNFLITDRNANPLYDKDANTGCSVKLKWKPALFTEPGLAYMQGVKELIWEKKLFDGTQISGFLYDAAEGLGLGDATPAAQEWVKAKWEEIGRAPYNSDQFRAYMFVLLKNALAKAPNTRTASEQKLLKSFANYIQQRRVYLAEQALGMYDAWKANDDQYRAETGQNRSFGTLFYYGTVPLDFQGTLSGLMALGGGAGSTLGSLVAANSYVNSIAVKSVDGVQVIRARSTVNGITGSLRYLQMASGLRLVAGSSLVQAVFAILGSIAIDQFVAIETARPKLENSLSLAKQNVDLDVMKDSDSGEDELYVHWARAMDTFDAEDSQVLQLASVAKFWAEQGGYAAPAKVDQLVSGKNSLGDRISSGTTSGIVNGGQKLVSVNGKYEAEMQIDGNFVIYAPNRQAIWATGTQGKGTAPFKLAMQADSNLVIYDSKGATWASGIHKRTAPYTLVMQDDGNLVILDKSQYIVWQSNTKR